MKLLIILLFVFSCLSSFGINPSANIARIMNFGDGKSIKTAYQVYTINEEYDLLDYLKLKSTMQILHVKDGFFYDELIIEKKSIFFKIIVKKLIKNQPKLVS